MEQEGGKHRAYGRRRRKVLFGLLLSVLIILTAINLLGYGPFRIPVEGPASVDLPQQMRAGVSYAVDEIDAFQEEFGRLPDTLDEMGTPDEGT